jgi:transposase
VFLLSYVTCSTPVRLRGIRSCGRTQDRACRVLGARETQVLPGSGSSILKTRAPGIVAQMDELFEFDAQAREQALSQEDRQLLRLEKSKPLLDEIKTQIQAARSCALPKSVLAKACNYTLTLWTRLTRFLEHPELELSNNLVENGMRPVALIKISNQGPDRSLTLARLRRWVPATEHCHEPIESALAGLKARRSRRGTATPRNTINSRNLPWSTGTRLPRFLVLPGLANFPINRVAELTPTAWAARNQPPNRRDIVDRAVG